jgi:hypothetical protein
LHSSAYGGLAWPTGTAATGISTNLLKLEDSVWRGLQLATATSTWIAFANTAQCFIDLFTVKVIIANTKWPRLLSWLLLYDLFRHFADHVALPTACNLATVMVSAASNSDSGQGLLKAMRVLRQEWQKLQVKPSRANFN